MQIRNLLLAGFAAFTIFVLLLYSRFTIKQKLRERTLQQQQQKSKAALIIADE